MKLSSANRTEEKWMSRRAVVAPAGWCCCCCCWCWCNSGAPQAGGPDPDEL